MTREVASGGDEYLEAIAQKRAELTGANSNTVGQFQGARAAAKPKAEPPRKNLRSRSTASSHAWDSRKRRQNLEDRFHENAAQYLDAMLPRDAFWTTFPSGSGGKARGGQLKAKGLKAGVPDILIVHQGRAHWLELKAPKGIVSDVQTHTHADLIQAQSPVAVCRTLDGIHEALTRWGFKLRGRLSA